MEIVVIAIVSLFASLLTFFSGFGLGTILSPVLAIFFPIETAIALTGIVHLLNNFFKIGLTFRNINWQIGVRFGLMSVAGAFMGAKLLLLFSGYAPLYTYHIGEKLFSITLIKMAIAVLMILFALFESIPRFKNIQFNGDKLYIGGLISGFFGGLSGNQGALRSAFLIRVSLTKEAFIATGILIACFVDVTRLLVYFKRMSTVNIFDNAIILIVSVLSAFVGAYFGNLLLKKLTIEFVQTVVTVMIVLIALCLGTGLI